ncbi:MAG TPA: flagellar biosynthetic protein FliO, partial [Gemmatimonadales bacterium]|nr:flagellar biosynthetic protein FliO [Gemmatimonadales bacterium]
MLGALGSLLVTLGFLGLALWLVKRWVPGARLPGSGGIPLEVLRRVSTGPKQGVALLRVGERVLVLSVSDQGSQLLTELDGADREQALDSGAGLVSVKPSWTPPRVSRKMAGVFKAIPFLMLLLAVLPQRAAAATVPAPALSLPLAPVLALQGAVRAPTAPKVTVTIGQGSEQLQLSGAVGIVVFMGAMTLLPAIFLLMTSFTRILIVLHFVRTAIGTQTAPPG